MEQPQRFGGRILLKFEDNGKLTVANEPNLDCVVCTDMASMFIGGCCFIADDEGIKIARTSDGEITVQSMHISCQSDTYQPGHNYGGIIIYQHNGNSIWETTNHTRCKPGYIVIQDTDSENVRKWMRKEPGAVHGAVYRNAFGESVTDVHVVGEGFSVQNGESKVEEFGIRSSVFNNPNGSIYHDHRRRMHELSEHCVRKIVEYWKTAGPCWLRRRNFEVKELLQDFDYSCIRNCCTEAEDWK